jgi:hypothetical protein
MIEAAPRTAALSATVPRANLFVPTEVTILCFIPWGEPIRGSSVCGQARNRGHGLGERRHALPKLAITTNVTSQDFAAMLDRAIAASGKALIELKAERDNGR